jgi:hypothetical protein
MSNPGTSNPELPTEPGDKAVTLPSESPNLGSPKELDDEVAQGSPPIPELTDPEFHLDQQSLLGTHRDWAWTERTFPPSRAVVDIFSFLCLLSSFLLPRARHNTDTTHPSSRDTRHNVATTRQPYAPFLYPFRPPFVHLRSHYRVHFSSLAPPLLDIALMSFLSSLASVPFSSRRSSGGTAVDMIPAENILSLSLSPPSLSSLKWTTRSQSRHLSYLHR